jgi:segregation and condensation protein B
MEKKEIKNILEVLFFITDEPISLEKLNEIFDKKVNKEIFLEIIDEIKKEYEDRLAPIELRNVAEGYQFATKPEYSQWVRKLFKDKVTLRLSQSALETLAIIAYKQPITRAELEEIRGVETISVLEKLLERKLIKIVGRKEAVGRPLLYGTTNEFLRYFGLVSISDLPSLDELAPSSTTENQDLYKTIEQQNQIDKSTDDLKNGNNTSE